MTILLEKNVELEKIKEEIASKEAEANQVDNNVESEVNSGSTDTLEPETVEEGTIQTKSEEEEL